MSLDAPATGDEVVTRHILDDAMEDVLEAAEFASGPEVARLNDCLYRMGISGRAHEIGRVSFGRGVPMVGGVPRVIPPEHKEELAAALVDYLSAVGETKAAAKIADQLTRVRAAALDLPKEHTVPEQPTTNPVIPPRTIKTRVAGAIKEGAKRAPVELALEEGQRFVVGQLLRGFKGTRQEKAAVRKFLLWFFSSPAGQVAIAAAISGGAPFVAGLVGKDGPVVQTVADEFAARAATITTKEGMKFAARQLKPLLSLFLGLFSSMEKVADKPAPALAEGGRCAIFDLDLERSKVGA